MQKEFNNFIQNKNLIQDKESVLVAVSGGIDSMVLLHLFQKLEKYTITVAHCNFKLRGSDSDKDDFFVREYCKKHHLKLHVKSFNTKSYASDNGLSIQMAARDLRFEWFKELCSTHGYEKIALAQHLDDQAETFFINLIRGTGIDGIHGILPINRTLIRPLLFTNRKQIEAFQKEHRIEYREDQSNKSDKYIRNYIRHHISPHFENIAPDFALKLDENISNFREVETFYKTSIRDNLRKISKKQNNYLITEIEGLKKLHSIKLHLRELLDEYGFNSDTINKVHQQIFNPKVGKIFHSKTHELLIDREQLILRKKKEKELTEYIINIDESISEPILLQTAQIPNNIKSYKTPVNTALFDFDKLIFPLSLRRWQKSDSFTPFGMNGRKKVSDFFIDNKLSNFEKEDIWVLLSEKNIIWIIGYRTDNQYCITKKTKNIYKITLEDGNN